MSRLAPSVHLSVRRARLLPVLVALVVGGLLTTAALPAQAGDVRVHRSLFGVHDGTTGLTSLTSVHAGSIRLWDAGVQWRDIQTSRTHYSWGGLDALVDTARAHHAAITMVIAGTPSFYSSTPWNVPDRAVAPFKTFVRKLMTRYRGRIDSYEVWNEPNITTFWTGSKRRMAQMTKWVHDIRNAVDRRAKVIAPSLVSRMSFELDWIKGYETQRLSGKPVWRYYDAAALSLYPLARYHGRVSVPEDAITVLNQAKQRLRAAGVPASKPIWDTEINYGLQSGSRAGTAAPRISSSRQAANVMRTYLLQAANGVKRISWYRYDWGRIAGGGTIGNTLLTDPDNSARVTAAGRALALAETWMHGRLVGSAGKRPCARDSRGTYTCVVTDSSGTRHIYWNPFHQAQVRLPGTARHKQGVLGGVTRVRGGSTLTVSYAPVMVSR